MLIVRRHGPAWQISVDDAEAVRGYDEAWEVRAGESMGT
jgi:hypothetical protein